MNPDDPQPDIAAALAKIRAGQQAAPPADIGAALAKLRAQKPAGHDYHAEFASGALDKRMQGANARDAATLAEDPTEHDPGVAGSIADAAQGIPGVGALEAGARSVVRGQPYAEAYRDIKGATDKVPTSAKLIGRGAASSPLMALIPGSAATSGAIIGGADQALSADPNIALGGFGGRVARTAYGAAGGAALGKGLELAGTGIRAGMATNAAKNVFGRMADRADAASKMFPAALAEGAGKPVPPKVSAFLEEPEVAAVVQRLQQTTHQGVPAESPEMLDAVNKVFSDQTTQAKKGLLAIDPSKPNTGRFTLQRLAQLKNQLYAAVSSPETITTTRELPPITTAPSKPTSLREAIAAHEESIAEAARRAQGTPLQQNKNPFSNQKTDAVPAHNDTRSLLERHATENVVSPSLSGKSAPSTIEEQTTVPAMMPSYPTANQQFAKASQNLDAFKTGYAGLDNAVRGTIPTAKQLTKTTPEAFVDRVAPLDDEGRAAAIEGVLGRAKAGGAQSMLFGGSRKNPFTGVGTLAKAPGLLRTLGDARQAKLDMTNKLLLLLASNAAPQ